jgi:predicted permease
LLLACAGGAAGLLLAPWLVALLVKTQSSFAAQTLLGETVDLRALAFTALSTLLAGIVFGAAPAWQGARDDLVPTLKEEGGVSDRRGRRFSFRSLLVVAQLALAIVVLAGAGLLIKSLRNLLALDPGYQTERVLVAPLDLDGKKYDEARGGATQRQFLERLSSLPGVEAASYGLVTPLSGSRFTQTLFVEGRQPLPNEQMAFDANVVGPRYHEAMGIGIVAGRGFTEQDRAGAPGVVIINETMARRFFSGENPLGKILRLGPGAPPLEIIGVARDIKHHDLTESPIPHFDLPALQRGYDGHTNFVARVKGRAADLIPSARGEMLALDPTLPVDGLASMSEQIGRALSALRLASTLIGVFGLLALLLAGIGLYGVMAWTVSRRTREIGVRMALGARGPDVLKLVLKQGMLLVGIGVATGLGATLLATRLVESLLYGVSKNDPATFAAVVLLLAGAALLACYVPARRATRVDPMVALRCE